MGVPFCFSYVVLLLLFGHRWGDQIRLLGSVALNLAPSRQFLVHVPQLLRWVLLHNRIIPRPRRLVLLLLRAADLLARNGALAARLDDELVLEVISRRVAAGALRGHSVVMVGNFELPESGVIGHPALHLSYLFRLSSSFCCLNNLRRLDYLYSQTDKF